MNNKQAKDRYVLNPLYICTIGIGVLCSLFNYLFLYNNPIIEIDDLYSDFFIPAGIVTLFVFVFLRPLINLMKYGDRFKDFLTFITIILSVVPIIIFQKYLKSETGTLTQVKTPAEIHQLPFTRYYKVSDYFIDTTNYFRLIDSHTYKSTLTLTSCFAIPLKNDTSAAETNTWYCSRYSDETHNGMLTNRKKIVKWSDKVIPEHILKMQLDAAYKRAVYFKRLTKSSSYDNYMEAISDKWKDKNPVFLEPEYESFEERTSGLFEWSVGTFLFANILLPLLYWFAPYKVNDFTSTRAAKLSGRIDTKKIKSFFAFFIPRKGIRFILITIYLNIIVFIIMVSTGVNLMEPGAADMIKWGGNIKPLTLGGEYYRLLSSMFIHSGILHLIMNMVSLYFIGMFIEPSSGTFKTSIVYLLSGIAGGLNSLYFHESNNVSVGASGAIFGLFGFFLALIITKNTSSEFKALLKTILIFIAYNLLIGLYGNTDLAAHIGGLVFGFVSGLFLFLYNKIARSN